MNKNLSLRDAVTSRLANKINCDESDDEIDVKEINEGIPVALQGKMFSTESLKTKQEEESELSDEPEENRVSIGENVSGKFNLGEIKEESSDSEPKKEKESFNIIKETLEEKIDENKEENETKNLINEEIEEKEIKNEDIKEESSDSEAKKEKESLNIIKETLEENKEENESKQAESEIIKEEKESISSDSEEKEDNETKTVENEEKEENHEESPENNEENGQESDDQQPEVPSLFITPKQEEKFTDKELDRELEKFMKTGRLPPQDMIDPLIHHISKKRVDAIEKSDYEVGEKMIEAQKRLKDAISKERSSNSVNSEEKSTSRKLKDAKENLKNAQKEKKYALQDIEEAQDKKMEELLEKHRFQVEDFKEKWKSPEAFHEFNKPSSVLINLRTKEKNYALTNDFKNAKIMKRRADRLEKEETERAQQKAIEEMKTQFRILEMKQQKEVDALNRLNHKLIMAKTVELDAEIHPLEMAVRKLERLNKDPPLPKRQIIVSKSRLVTSREVPKSRSSKPIVSTPRTRDKLIKIRSSAKPNTLDLKEIDISKYIKKPKLTTPRREKKYVYDI